MASSDSAISSMIRNNVETLEEMNIRTFTKWINSKLSTREPEVVVKDLIKDLQDGRVLLSLLEALLKTKLRAEKGKLRFHKINNVNKALKKLEEEGLKLHGISAAAVVDGNKISILGLVWIIILHFQVQGIMFEEEEKQDKEKSPSLRKKSVVNQAEVEKLLIKWVQDALKGFSDVLVVNDLVKSWQDGLAFIFLLFVFRPSAVDVDKAQTMTILERLEYAFSIAEKEFQVHPLLDPIDVEKGNVDKKAMLMYLSALYEALRNLEPAVVETTSREVSEGPGEEGIVKTTTSFVVESKPGSSTLRIGDEVIEITTVSTNEIVLRYKTIYYQVLYTIKALETRMEKIRVEEPSQENALELQNVQKEMQELQVKVKELNETNKEMAEADDVDRQEFSDIQTELRELSSRWSVLIQHNNEEIERQPAIVKKVRTTQVRQVTRLTIGDEVIEITSVSTNEIVIRYKIVYYEIITIIKIIEANMKRINEEEPSQETAKLLDENKQRMEQLRPKISEMNELMSQMTDADGVDPDELSQVQSELSDFNSRISTVTEDISKEEKRQPALTTEIVYKTTTNVVESAPSGPAHTTVLQIDDHEVEITTVSTNEIVLHYKTLYYQILYKIRALETRMNKIRAEEPSQENAIELRNIQTEMQELQVKVKELNETNKEMAKAEGVDRHEFSDIRTELGQLSSRWSTLIQHSNEEVKRQRTFATETVYKTITTAVESAPSGPAHTTTLQIDDHEIEITTVSTNEIVLHYKTLYYQILYKIRALETRMNKIRAEEPSQENAMELRNIQKEMQELQVKIKELNRTNKEMAEAEGVDRHEFSDTQTELGQLSSRWSTLIQHSREEIARQPRLVTYVQGGHKARLTVGGEVIEITTVSTNEIVIKYKIVYYQIITVIKMIEANMKRINEEEPSQETARLLDENKQRMEQLQPKIAEMNELLSQMTDADGVDPDELSQSQSELSDFNSRMVALTDGIKEEDKRQPRLTTRTTYTVKTTYVEGGRTAQLREGDQVIEFKTVSTNEIVMRYKILHYQVAAIVKLIVSNMIVVKKDKPSERTAVLLQENEQRMEQLQPMITEMNELMSQMKDADGVDPDELAQLQAELSDFNLKMSVLTNDFAKEKKRQSRDADETITPTTTEAVETQPSRRTTVKYGDEVYEITTISTNEMVVRYQILYYEIISLIKILENNQAQIKDAPPNRTTAAMLKQNQDQMDEIQRKIRELREIRKNMDGADGVDPQELSQLQGDLDTLGSRWTAVTIDIESDRQRIASALDNEDRQKASIDDWRDKCEAIGDWMDGIEDKVEVLETRKPSSDLSRANHQMNECEALQETIKSDEVPASIFLFGEEITSEESNLTPEQKSKIQMQMAEMKKEIKKLSDRAGDAKHRYKQAIDHLEEEKKQRLAKLKENYQDLDKEINVLIEKGDKIGTVEGDPAAVRAKETLIELLVSDIQVFQPRFDEFRQLSWEVLEDPSTDETEREDLKKKVTSLEERWGALIRSVYSRSETAKNLISKLPQAGVLEELIIVENLRHDYKIDWRAHHDLFAMPEGHDQDTIEEQIYRERWKARWRRECRELDEALLDVERENSELGGILNDPSKGAMKKAKMEVIQNGLKKVEKEYNDLPEYAKLLFDDPKTTEEDRKNIEDDLDSYKVRYDELLTLVTERAEAIKQQQAPKSTIVVTESYVPEKKEEIPVEIIVPQSALDDNLEHIPDASTNAEDIGKWWDDDRKIVNWIKQVEIHVKQADSEPATSDLVTTRKQHANIERITQEIGIYETNVTLLENKGNAIVNDPATTSDDRQNVQDEVKSVKRNWDSLKENAFKVERNLYEQVNKLQQYWSWTQKSEALSGWLDDTERSLNSCTIPATSLETSSKQNLFLEKFLKERGQNQESVDDVLSRGNLVVNKSLVPEQHLPKIKQDLVNYREKWNELLKKAQEVQYSVRSREYEIITTWIIRNEKRVQDFNDDPIEDDEALKRRQVITMEIIEETRVYIIRLRQLIDQYENPTDQEAVPADKDKLVKDLKEYEKRLDVLQNDARTAHDFAPIQYEQHKNNKKNFEEWNIQFLNLGKWFETTEKEIASFKVPPQDDADKELQIKYQKDFATLKPEHDERVKDIVYTGQQLLDDKVIPVEKRQQYKKDLESYPGFWDNVVKMADEHKDNLDSWSTGKSIEEYDSWREDVVKNTEMIENKKQDVETSSQPTSDAEEQKRQLEAIAKLIVEKPEIEGMIMHTISRGKDLEDDEYLSPERKENVRKESRDLEVKWGEFTNQLDDAKIRIESGGKDLEELAQYHVVYNVIITWITTNEKRLQELKNDDGEDKDSIEKRQIILKNITEEFPEQKNKLSEVIAKGQYLSNTPSLPPGDREKIKKQSDDVENRFNTLENDVGNEGKKLNDNLKNIEIYENWQVKCDDVKDKLAEIKENLEKFDSPTSDVAEREKQKRFLNDFNKKKPAQEKTVNDVVREGQRLVDENIVPSDKRGTVKVDLQSLNETWDNLVAKADDNKKTVDSSLQDAVQLNKWRNDYNIVLLWIEKAEDKQKQREEDGDDLDKLKKQRKKLETDLKDVVKYESKIAPVLLKGEAIAQSKFISPDDAKGVDDDGKALKERYDRLKNDETDRKQKLDDKIQWLTDHKQYLIDVDALNITLDDNQKKLESCEKPTSNKAERDKQASFLNKFTKDKPANDKRVDVVLEFGNKLASAPGAPEDKGDEIKEETKTLADKWRIIALKVEELQKIVSSGIQNITELSEWRREYVIVTKWIEMNEKKLASQGEPGNQHKDLSNKCTTLDEMVNLLPTYETRVVLLLEKGEQLAKESSIDETDRKQTEDDTKALRERWNKLKEDEQETKKRFDSQKGYVEDYQDWKDNAAELKPWLENTKKEMDACHLPTSDNSVREKQASFIKVFVDDKEKNQARVDNVNNRGELLLKENPVAQKDENDIKDTMDHCRNSWDAILQQFDDVENSVTKGAQDIVQLEEWRKDHNQLTKSLDNAKQQLRNLKKPSKDPIKMNKQKEDFELISSEMDDKEVKVSDLSQKAEYLTTISSISQKDKDKTAHDLEQLENSWNNYKSEENTARVSFDVLPVEPVSEVVELQQQRQVVVESSFQDVNELFDNDLGPVDVDFGEWKDSVRELEQILDEEDKKYDPKSEVEKEYSNLEKLAQDTKDSGATVNNMCKPQLTKILSSGNALINSKQLEPADEAEVTDKMASLKDKTHRVDTAIGIVRMKVRDAVLYHFNEDLNECSVSVNKMQETAKPLRSPANDLSGVRVQIASMKSIEKRLALDGAKVQDTEDKINKMEDGGVLPRDGFAGTLNDRCNEVRKEQENVRVAIEEAKPKLHRALLNQLNRTRKAVSKWLNLCEKKERNVDVSDVKDLDMAHQECVKLKQAKSEFDGGEPQYIALTEAHKEAVDDAVLVDKKAVEFEKHMEGLTTRHDDLKKNLADKENQLLSYVRQFTDDVLNSAEEKLEEQKIWLEPEDQSNDFSTAKEQQDRMKEHESTIKQRARDLVVQLGPVDKIASGEILPQSESTALQRRIADVKNRSAADVPAATKKSQKIQEDYADLLKKEIEKRKAWLDDHEGHVPAAEDDFKDFNEFKVKYDQNKGFGKELDENNILVLLEEADKIDGVEPELKDELKELNERWEKIHDDTKDKTDWYEDLMTKWAAFREQQLTFLNWIDEKDNEVSGNKDQVNLADEDEVAEHINFLKNVKEDAEGQGASQEKKLKETSEDLIRLLGSESPAAEEINKQMEEVDSCRNDLISDVSERIEKIESSEQKTRDMYNDMDDVTTWLDTTENLIDTFENHEKHAAEDDSLRDQHVAKEEVEEEMVHVVEDILSQRKKIPERELQLNNAVVCVESLEGQLDETTTENAVAKVNEMKDRWGVVTQRLDTFCNRDIPEIEIAEIKAEHLDEESLEEIDLTSVVALDEWREKVRKVNLLLKYVERLVGVNADDKIDYSSIRISASNTKEAEKSINLYCKPRVEVITVLGNNIIDNEPDNADQKEEITTTIDTLTKRIEFSENSTTILKMKVRDLALDYFNKHFNNCEVSLESEDENVNKLLTAKPDLETTQEQMVLLKEGRKEFNKNQEHFEDILAELNDRKIAEFLLKEGFQGTLVEKSDDIKRRRDTVEKQLSECETRIYRNLILHLTEMKKVVAKWLTSCEKKEKAITVESTPSHDPVVEYRKLKDLREEMDEGEPKYEGTVQLNKQLVADNVLEGRKAASSEKELQSFASRFAALGKHFHDKRNSLYSILLNLAKSKMDDVKDGIEEANEKVNQTILTERFPQVKQDFQNAKNVKEEVDEICEKSTGALKEVHSIVALDVFNDDDRKTVDDRRTELKDENSKLADKSEEKFDNFAKQYNIIIENEVKNRKMWLHENESWMSITDNEVNDLPGFAKKLDEQKIFQEELEYRKMEGLIDEARENEELSPDTRITIYELDDKWNTLNTWSDERLAKLDKITVDWRTLREQEKELLDNIDDNDAMLKLASQPIDLSDKKETKDRRTELKELQSDAQELGLNVVKLQRVSRDLIKLVGPDSSAAKLIEKEAIDISTCHANLCNDTLTRIKKLDASERKTKALYDHMDDINVAMDESESILKSLGDELKMVEEKKDKEKEEVIENEQRDDELKEEKDKPSADLNKFVDQISLRLGERPEEKARVLRAKELEAGLEEELSDDAKNNLQKQVEDFDNRWEGLSKEMDKAIKDSETSEEKPEPVKVIQMEDVQSALPEDLTVDYGLWKGDAAKIDESILKYQTVLQAFDIDVRNYSSLKTAETETQDIIDQMNTEIKPRLITLRSSGEKISKQDPSVTDVDVDDTVNASQKNLEGLQSALQLRKLRLRDSSVQHINERILDCEASVGDEQVKLQLLTPPGKDLDTVLDQLSALQESEETFHTNQAEFEEVQVHLNELKQSKILTSPEFQEQFQDDCRHIALERAQILKQTKDHKNKLYRAIVNIFEVRRKEIAKWLKNCEKKEKEVPNELNNLDEALVVLKKIKEAEDVLEQGESNYHETVVLSKTLSEKGILVDKKANDAENDMKNSSIRYNQVLEDVQNKKNKLYKTMHELLELNLDETEQEIKQGEEIVQIESRPDDPTSTHEELSNLQGVVNTSDQLREDSGKLFDLANMLLSANIFPLDDKRELRARVINLDKRAYELPDAAKDKYEKIYSVYLKHLTKLIELRVQWISANEPRMEELDATDASDISVLESKLGEHEEFKKELEKNNIHSVLEQIRDKNEVDPEVSLPDLLILEKRWEILHIWAEGRKVFLQQTLDKWKAFKVEEKVLIEWIDKKDGKLQELDTPVNLADENAVQERLEALKDLQSDLIQHLPNLDHFKKSGTALLEDLKPESQGAKQVNKEIEDFESCWKKLEKDIENKIEKMEKSNRTIMAIYSYLDTINNWLDETDGKLREIDTRRDELRPVSGLSPLSFEEHRVDGSPEKETGDKSREEGDNEKTAAELKVPEGPQGLGEDEKEQLRETIQRLKDEIETNSSTKDLQKARIERVRLLVDDIKDSVDEDGANSIEERICEIGERFEGVDARLNNILQKAEPDELVIAVSEPELVTIQAQTSPELQSGPPSEQQPEGTPQDTGAEVGKDATPVEPYSGQITLDLMEWRAVVISLRDFLNRMQLNIRDVDSKNYVQMRECEVDTKLCIDAMGIYGKPCLNDLIISGNGMLESPEYTDEEKNEIRATLESLTVGAQFVNFNAKDQRMRLYRALVSYQGDQRKLVQRWLNSCAKESKEINEDVAGLEASDVEYKKVQHLKTTIASGEPTFLHYKELSRRMIQHKVFRGKKGVETEKDIVNFTTTYEQLQAETQRKDKCLYTTVVKSISLPLESIEIAVTEAESWVQPEELANEYAPAKEQLSKMKLSVFVIETLHTRAEKVLKETEGLVSDHEHLTAEDKKTIVDRVHSLTPRTESLPASAVNKYKRMSREFLVLIESEVESREAWITKSEPKMLSPAGDVEDLEGFEQLKDAHDDFLEELKCNEMSEYVKDSESPMEFKKETTTKILELQMRWTALLGWAIERTVYLNTVIGTWQEFRLHEVTASDFIDAKEKDLQRINEDVKPDSDEFTKEQVDELESMQAETRENSLEIWQLQRKAIVLVKSIGEGTPASKSVEQQTRNLIERNEKLSGDISAAIDGLVGNQYKVKKLQEHLGSVNEWINKTKVFVDEFNNTAAKLTSDKTSSDKATAKDVDVEETPTSDEKEDDAHKIKEDREEKVHAANELVHNIAIKRVDTGEYKAMVDRIDELHAELPGEANQPIQQSELDVQVEELNANWTNLNSDVDKVAWMKIPGVDSLQAVTYILHDMQVNKAEDVVAGVETFDQWKEKVSELEVSVGKVEGKFKPEKSMGNDYVQIRAVFSNIQECQEEIDDHVRPKLELIRLAGVKFCTPSDHEHVAHEAVSEELKTEISTTVLSLHERIESVQTIIQLQRLRLGDAFHEYFHERVRSDQRHLAEEQTERKRLFPVGEDDEMIILHLEIVKESEKTFETNDKTFQDTQEQLKEVVEKRLTDDQELISFLTENNKNLGIQRKTLDKLFIDIKQKLRRNLVSKYNSSKTGFNKWLKNMAKREKTVDVGAEGVDRSFIECTKLESMVEDLPTGEEMNKRVVKLLTQIHLEVIWGEVEVNASTAEVNSLRDRHESLKKSVEDKRNTLNAKIKNGLDETLGVAEKSISEAETLETPSVLSDKLEQATGQIQQSMENVTNVNNMYTQIMQSLKRPQEIAKSGVLPDDISVDVDNRCRDLTRRVSRLPSVVVKNHKSLFEAFTLLLHNLVNEREQWILQNETNVMVSFVSVASLEDLKSKLQETKEFIVEIHNHNMEPVIVEIEKMSEPDFKLKATSKDLQNRLLAIEKSAEERELVLLSILNQWESMREKLRELLDWVDLKDLKLNELKEQVNLADEEEVKGELVELKTMQTAMEDEYPEVVNMKKMGESLQKILGDECEASARVDKQVKDFMECWDNLAKDIQKKIKTLESSERQLSTMHRYMDNTHDWMDDVTDLLDQHEANQKRLQGLPIKGKPKESEDKPQESDGELKEVAEVSEEEAKFSEEKAEVAEVEPDLEELSEDEKEKLRQENGNLVEAFVIKRHSRATCQAFVDWARELGKQVSDDLDDDSRDILTVRIDKFNSDWDVFTEKIEEFSQENAEGIKLIEFQLAEQQSEDLPETATFEEWKTEVDRMNAWFDMTDKKCADISISRDSTSLRKGEQETKTISMAFSHEGKPRFNKIIVLGRRLIDSKTQSSEEEQEITVTITKFTKRMVEVERVVELHRIRTLEMIVGYCKEKLDDCQSAIERDEVNMGQLTPSGETPDAVHEQIVLLKVCENEIPQHEEEFVEIQTYIMETRHPVLISYETQMELENSCNLIEKRRTDVDKQLKGSHGRLYRTLVNFFDQRKKVTLKWLSSCERKGRQVKPNVKDLKDSKIEYMKVKEIRKEFDVGRQNLVAFIDIHKLVVADSVLDDKRSSQAEKDVNTISGRVEQVDKVLHDQETKLYTTLLTTLTLLLDSVEVTISDARGRIKPEEVISTYFKTAKKQMDETKVMARDIHTVRLATNKQLEQGDDIKRAKLLGPEDADTIELRLCDLMKKFADLQEAASDKELRMRVEYVTTFKTELERCSQWITFLEMRVEKTSAEADDYHGYKQLKEEHAHFEEDLKVYDLNLLVKEVDKIDDLEPAVKQDLAALEKRWKKLLRWAEERGLRLTKIVTLWSKFRQEEIEILKWIDEKNLQLKTADEVNLADEVAVKEHLEVFKSLGPEREEYVRRSLDMENMGHELKRIVGENSKAGGSVQQQLIDHDQCFNDLIKQIVKKIAQLESAQQRLRSLTEEMNNVNTWCNETEVLLDEFDQKEQHLQDLNIAKADESQEIEDKKETKKEKRARIKEEKANLSEEMIETIEKLSVKFEKLQLNEAKVKRVNTMGEELKKEILDSEKQEVDAKLQPFNDRFNNVSARLKDMENRDLPESSGCWFVRFMQRKLFRASID